MRRSGVRIAAWFLLCIGIATLSIGIISTNSFDFLRNHNGYLDMWGKVDDEVLSGHVYYSERTGTWLTDKSRDWPHDPADYAGIINNLFSVDSSAISEIGYLLNKNVLGVRFTNTGAVYVYYDVPYSEYAKLKVSPSIGNHFYYNIRGKYQYEKITDGVGMTESECLTIGCFAISGVFLICSFVLLLKPKKGKDRNKGVIQELPVYFKEKEKEVEDKVVLSSAERQTNNVPDSKIVEKQKQVHIPERANVSWDEYSESQIFDTSVDYEIMEIIGKRKIQRIVHFTPAENLLSIFTHGLLTRPEMAKRGLEDRYIDKQRGDGFPSALCLSVSFPNYLMFYKYRSADWHKYWCVIVIDPVAVAKSDVLFYPHNASSWGMRDIPINELEGGKAFETMFSPTQVIPDRLSAEIQDSYTTDPQAEILCFDCIDTKYIREVIFEDVSDFKRYSYLIPNGITKRIDNSYFGPRKDWRIWKKDRERREKEAHGLWEEFTRDI